MQASKPPAAVPGMSKPAEQYTEYKLRVPKNLIKRYNVMKINNPKPIKLADIKEANMVRKTKKQVYIEEETTTMPQYGAGSVYNFDRKEEARRKRRGYATKEIDPDDLPYALRLDGKGGKRYTGRKEPILDHSAYYIITQSPDGVFQAVPVQAWYNFMPDIDYQTLTSDEVEQEFLRRDRTLSYFTKKYSFGNLEEFADQDSKVRRTADGGGLVIHDDDQNENDEEDFDDPPSDDDKKKTKQETGKKNKNIYRGKKRKNNEDGEMKQDSDEEEDMENLESKEVDYMSESSSEDELNEMDDEPDPEKADAKRKAKDELNLFSDSSSESEGEGDKQLNDAGKELKAMLKGDRSNSSEEDDEEDEDIDSEYSKSAIFMQGKDGKKKKKNGSNNGSKPTSRSSTPVQQQNQDQTSDTLNQAAKSLKDTGLKRSLESSTPSPSSKKQKLGSIATASKRSNSPLTVERSASPSVRSGTPSDRSGTPSDSHSITEEAIRRYLTHKPMTTTDLMRKFKLKKTGLSKEQTVNAIAAILKKIEPHQEKIDGKLYLSIKTKK